ncbi:MAG TPA: aminotransferase class I/II-fold pyridoxal phosphate-dependent enzyme [Prochlorococcus sp.]|nr:aminotransferase class I/II-fold pyridoxal phosphate-dependent enzyme [Prochlorococcaceae cyanobacterium ETNP18_MAG_17]
MATSRRLGRLGRGVFDRNDRRKQAYRYTSAGTDALPLVDLSLGSTDLPPPAVALEAIEDALRTPESSSYCLQAATRPFREAVAAWSKRRFGVSVDPDREVLLLVGSQEGTAHLPLAVLDPGDAALILDPSYPSHRGGLVLADARIERLQLRQEQCWRPDFNALSNSKWDQLRMMVFGFPHNPTAQVGEQSWLAEAMERGIRHQVVVAHDNPYVDLALEGDAPALLLCPGWREWGIEFFSFSKGWCLGGFRLAFAIGAEPLITALRELKGVVDFNQSLALQRGAIAALSDAPDWPQQILEVYRERRDRTLAALGALGWHVPCPSMALYLWLPVPTWAKQQGFNDETLAADLLDRTGIALTPGSGFGSGGDDWLRLALVQPVEDLEAAVARMGPWWHAHI